MDSHQSLIAFFASLELQQVNGIFQGQKPIRKKNLKKLVPNNNVLKSAFMFSYLGPRKRNYALQTNKGNLVGFALTTNENPVLYLDLIVTKVHGKGYGQMLMSRIKNNAKKNGFSRINLSTVKQKTFIIFRVSPRHRINHLTLLCH